jgi:hypothetical protein
VYDRVASRKNGLPNMTVWVVRKTLDGDTVGAPCLCAKPGHVARVPGLLTIEEHLAILLSDRESVQDIGVRGLWKIVEENRPTGFIEILEGSHGKPA